VVTVVVVVGTIIMTAPSGLVENEEFVGLIRSRDVGNDDDDTGLIELTEADTRSRGNQHRKAVVGFRGPRADDNDEVAKKRRRIGLIFAGSTFLFLILVLRSVLDPKNSFLDPKSEVLQRRRQQILHYRNGTALIINVHVTHHAGTTMSGVLGRAPNTSGCPAFACNHPTEEDNVNETEYPKKHPWTYNQTEDNIAIVRKYFHFIGWEFRTAPKIPLSETNWESPNLVSIYVTRDPISRMFAGSAYVQKHYPFVHNADVEASKEDWMAFAEDDFSSNNYTLRVLAGDGCCNGTHTERRHLETAKALLSRFTFILDISCLWDGLEAVADQLGLELELPQNHIHKAKTHAPVSERFPEVYQYMLDRHKLSIELHEWAKENAVVRCNGNKTRTSSNNDKPQQ
jgi:hypothetical protein